MDERTCRLKKFAERLIRERNVVNTIFEDGGGVTGFGEGSEGTGSGVDAGEADREDGNADSGVDEVFNRS
jgi:hypothetical protein